MKQIIFVFLVLAMTPVLLAEEVKKPLRLLLHGQTVEEDANFGIAAWGIIPDATADKLRILGVFGFVWKWDEGWIELLAGGFLSEGGQSDRVLNVRSLFSGPLKSKIYLEAMRAFDSRRLQLQPNISFPLFWKIRVRMEADLIFAAEEQDRVSGFGPGIVVPLPKFPKVVSFATSYQRRFQGNERADVLRGYLLFNFVRQ